MAIRPLIEEVMALMAAGAAQKGIALGCEVADAVPERVVTDAMRLRQVLTNLLSNATKFTEAGSISVSADYAAPARGRPAAASRSATPASAFPPSRLGQVFEQFVQIDNSLTRRTGGTGLGLAIAKQLVELMGGDISVTSTPGEGSVFRFSIRARPGGAARGRGPGADAGRRRPRSRRCRVLLAEDNATNQYLIGAFLHAGGHSMVTVADGGAAVAAVAAGGFDVVLMDVQMPVLDGLAATRAIRALPGPAGRVPIVALTANAMSGDREECLAAGMDDYLAKPVEAAALAAALARVGGGADAAGASRRVASRRLTRRVWTASRAGP